MSRIRNSRVAKLRQAEIRVCYFSEPLNSGGALALAPPAPLLSTPLPYGPVRFFTCPKPDQISYFVPKEWLTAGLIYNDFGLSIGPKQIWNRTKTNCWVQIILYRIKNDFLKILDPSYDIFGLIFDKTYHSDAREKRRTLTNERAFCEFFISQLVI